MKINLINEERNSLKAGDVVFNTISEDSYLVVKSGDDYALLDLKTHEIITLFKSIDQLKENNVEDHYRVVKSNKVELNVDFS